MQDVVIVFVTVTGERDGRHAGDLRPQGLRPGGGRRDASAIQITTAAGICAVLDLLADGQLPQRGFIRQEDIRLDDVPGEPLRPRLCGRTPSMSTTAPRKRLDAVA